MYHATVVEAIRLRMNERERTPDEYREIQRRQAATDIFGVSKGSKVRTGQDITPGQIEKFSALSKRQQRDRLRKLTAARAKAGITTPSSSGGRRPALAGEAGLQQDYADAKAVAQFLQGHKGRSAAHNAKEMIEKEQRLRADSTESYEDQVSHLQARAAPGPEGESSAGIDFSVNPRDKDPGQLADLQSHVKGMYDSIEQHPKFKGKVQQAHMTLTMLLKRHGVDKHLPPGTLPHSDEVDGHMETIARLKGRGGVPKDAPGNPTDHAWSQHMGIPPSDVAMVKDHVRQFMIDRLAKEAKQAPMVPHKRATYVPLSQAEPIPKERLAKDPKERAAGQPEPLGSSALDVARRIGQTQRTKVDPTTFKVTLAQGRSRGLGGGIDALTGVGGGIGGITGGRGTKDLAVTIGAGPSSKPGSGDPLKGEFVSDVPTYPREPGSFHGMTRGAPAGTIVRGGRFVRIPAKPPVPAPGRAPEPHEIPPPEPSPPAPPAKPRRVEFDPRQLQVHPLSQAVPAQGRGMKKAQIKAATRGRVQGLGRNKLGESLTRRIIFRTVELRQECINE